MTVTIIIETTVLIIILIILLLVVYRNKIIIEGLDEVYDEYMKNREFKEIYHRWLTAKQKKKGLDGYFRDKGIERIAIYGMNDLCVCLQKDLGDSNIEIICIIDKNARKLKSKYKIITPDETPDGIDAIVVTAVHYYDDIFNEMRKKVNCKIISIGDVIYSL